MHTATALIHEVRWPVASNHSILEGVSAYDFKSAHHHRGSAICLLGPYIDYMETLKTYNEDMHQ